MKCTRRQVLVGFFGLAAGGALAARFGARRSTPVAARPPALPFPPAETATLHAAIEHALPGALAAGVADHLAYWMTKDRYFQGFAKEFQEGAMQLDRVAREVGGKVFPELSTEQKDTVFKKFQGGGVRVPNLDGAKFFEHLVTLTLEGFLADPKYGGNRDQVGWKFIGFTPCWWAPRSHGGGADVAAPVHDHSKMGH